MIGGKSNRGDVAKLRKKLEAQELLSESALNILIERYEDRKAKTKSIYFWKINEYDCTIDALEKLLGEIGIKKSSSHPTSDPE